MRHRAWLLLCLCYCGSVLAQQQYQQQLQQTTSQIAEPSLEELLRTPLNAVPRDVEITTASRTQQSADTAPAITYLVTSQDIRLFQLRTLAEVLQLMPGIQISSDGGFHYIGVRGLGRHADFNSRLLFLIDGVRANDNIGDAMLVGTDAIVDVESIERVEFTPGPGSALYGNNAFFGVLNIVTKGVSRLHGVALSIQLDSLQQQQLRLNFAHREQASWESWLSASINERPNIPLTYPAPDQFTDLLQSQNHEDFYRLQGGFKSSGWLWQGAYNQRKLTIPIGLSEPFTPEVSDISERNYRYRISKKFVFSTEWELDAKLSQSGLGFQRLEPYQDPRLQRFVAETRMDGRWRHIELQLANRSFASHLLLAGFEHQQDLLQQITIGDAGFPPAFTFIGNNHRTGIFLQDLWQILPEHTLVLGARFDDSETGPAITTPRVAWIWQTTADMTLKLMHGSAFRVANLNEFSTNALTIHPIPSEEKIETTELAWQHYLTSQLQYRLAFFQSNITDLIEIDPFIGAFINGSALRSHGLDAGIEYRGRQQQQFRLNWSWQNTRYQQQTKLLENSPSHLLNILYNQPLFNPDFIFSWQTRAVSQRETLLERLPGYVLHNANILWQLSDELELSFGIHNLTQTRYYDQPSLTAPPIQNFDRTVRIALQWRLHR
ncbi:TonB-dependent receptor plug domain-containing protein [Rheinheimera riviphila]|nr:TonB-dependent receptor [Rheinheimera riviphila]